jgi:hypothetical protein
MSACLLWNPVALGIELIPLLLKTVEKAVAQPAQVCEKNNVITAWLELY